MITIPDEEFEKVATIKGAIAYGITCTADRNKEMKLEVEITPPGKRWKP